MSPDGGLSEPVVLRETGMGHWTGGPGHLQARRQILHHDDGQPFAFESLPDRLRGQRRWPAGPLPRAASRRRSWSTPTARTEAWGILPTSSGRILTATGFAIIILKLTREAATCGETSTWTACSLTGTSCRCPGPTRHFVEAPARPDAWGWADEAEYQVRVHAVGRRRPAQNSDAGGLHRRNEPRARSRTPRFASATGTRATASASEIAGGQMACSACPAGVASALASRRRTCLTASIRTTRCTRCGWRSAAESSTCSWTTWASFYGLETGPAAGEIGARGAGRVGYVAFSRHVGQRGDFEHLPRGARPGGRGDVPARFGGRRERRPPVGELRLPPGGRHAPGPRRGRRAGPFALGKASASATASTLIPSGRSPCAGGAGIPRGRGLRVFAFKSGVYEAYRRPGVQPRPAWSWGAWRWARACRAFP